MPCHERKEVCLLSTECRAEISLLVEVVSLDVETYRRLLLPLADVCVDEYDAEVDCRLGRVLGLQESSD